MKKSLKLLYLFVVCGTFCLSVAACSDENDEPELPNEDIDNNYYYSDLLKCSSEDVTLSFKEFYSPILTGYDAYVYELHIPAKGGKYELCINERASWKGDEPSVLPPFNTWHSHLTCIREYAEGFENGPSDNDTGYFYRFLDDRRVNESAEWEAPFGHATTGFSKVVFDIEPNEKSSERNYEAIFEFTSIDFDDSSKEEYVFHYCGNIELKIYQDAR